MPRRIRNVGELIRPLWPFTINRDSPQARGLVRWWPLGYTPGGESDLIVGSRLSDGSTTIVTDPKARVMRNFTGTETMSVAAAALTATPVTLGYWFVADTAVNNITFSLDDGSASNQFALRHSNTGSDIQARTNGANAETSTNYTLGSINHACGAYASATSRAAFLNGGGKGTDATSATPTGINRTIFNQGNNFDGKVFDARIYNRALTDLEVASYFSDPRLSLDLYYPLGRRTFSYPRRVEATPQPKSNYDHVPKRRDKYVSYH